MCGFAGAFALAGPLTDAATVARMGAAIRHRGPDDEGAYADQRVSFSHKRLSIIDLSASGHQPMSNADGGIWIAYNGEIYNYRELDEELRALGHVYRSQSDTETIIHAYEAWGSACVHRFNGMFSFALWDRRTDRLFCARDRFGEKPFYYTQSPERLLFASEIKALLQDPSVGREPNQDVLWRYLAENQTDVGDRTFFRGIRTLPAAHTLLADRGGVYVQRYWTPPPLDDVIESRSEQEWTEGFRALLKDSIRLRLRSDVPVGTCLSGGLDSSSIMTLVSQMTDDRPSAFSVVYDEPGFEEHRFVRAVADAMPLTLHVVRPTGADLLATTERLVWHNDEPSSSHGQYSQWQVMKLAADHGITVLLNGQGGDELLAGYHRYVPTYLRELLGTWHVAKACRVLFGSLKLQGRSIHENVKQAVYPRVSPGLQTTYRRLVSGHQLPEDFIDRGLVRFVGLGQHAYLESRAASFETLFRHLHQDLTVTSVPALVHHEDRCSMAFSREIRLPFLDYRLVEYMATMPPDMKIRGGVSKYVLRQAMRSEGLPEAVLNRFDKKGYPTPMGKWFATTAQTQVRDILWSERFRTRGVIDVPRAQQGFEQHVTGQADLTLAIWQWINVELWYRTFIDGPLAAAV